MRLHCLGLVSVVAVTLVLVTSGPGFAQDVTEPTLKAAFIYNFAKFTEWPSTVVPPGPLLLCVLGDAVVGQALTRAVQGRNVAGHSLDVWQGPARLEPARVEPARICHVLYVSGVTVDQLAPLVAAWHDKPVLTMSDIDGFTGVGGITQCFFEHGQLRFAVHLQAVTRAGLQISSRLLALARIQ